MYALPFSNTIKTVRCLRMTYTRHSSFDGRVISADHAGFIGQTQPSLRVPIFVEYSWQQPVEAV